MARERISILASKAVWIRNGGDFVMYSDDLSTEKVHLYGSTGKGVFTIAAGTVSGEEYGLALTCGGTLSSGDALVGANIAVTPVGANASWVAGIFSKVVESATKRVDGYMAAGEFEVQTACDTASASACLVLQWANTSANQPANAAYIMLKDWGTTRQRALFEFGSEHTIGSDGDTTSLLSANNPTAATHAIRCTINNVPYWIMAVNLTGLTA